MELPGSGQMDAVTGRAQAAGDEARLRALQQKTPAHTREDLARTAREFESVFLDILMPLDARDRSRERSDGRRRRHEDLPADARFGDGPYHRRLPAAGWASRACWSRISPTRSATSQRAEAGEADGALALPAGGRDRPASLALSRYRQIAGTAAATAAGSPSPSPLQPLFGPPAPADLTAMPSMVPTAADRDRDAVSRRQVSSVAPPSEATSRTAPARAGLVPTDRRLAGRPAGDGRGRHGAALRARHRPGGVGLGPGPAAGTGRGHGGIRRRSGGALARPAPAG